MNEQTGSPVQHGHSFKCHNNSALDTRANAKRGPINLTMFNKICARQDNVPFEGSAWGREIGMSLNKYHSCGLYFVVGSSCAH